MTDSPDRTPPMFSETVAEAPKPRPFWKDPEFAMWLEFTVLMWGVCLGLAAAAGAIPGAIVGGIGWGNVGLGAQTGAAIGMGLVTIWYFTAMIRALQASKRAASAMQGSVAENWNLPESVPAPPQTIPGSQGEPKGTGSE